jgi:tetratricopeptide (TPR) repeat protein
MIEVAFVLAALQAPVDWKSSLPEGLAQGRSEGRLVVVHFYYEGRPASRQMDEETLRHPEVLRVLGDGFVPVRIDSSREEELFRKLVGGRGGLATCVLDGTEDVILAAGGFQKPEVFVGLLTKAREGYPKLKEARERSARQPGNAAWLYELGLVYEALGSPRRSEDCFLGAASAGEGQGNPAPKDPRSSALAHERLARLQVMRGRNREARLHLARCRALDPDDRFGSRDRARLSEAYALAVERRLGESIELLEKLRKDVPGAPEMDQILVLEGWLWHESGQDARALELLGSLLGSFPRSAWVALARERIDHIQNPPPDHPH